MKSVLISIQPYWLFLIIANKMGWRIEQEKTVEVRKNYPKAEDWDRTVKLYCSKDKKSFARIPKKYQPLMELVLGKVIGEFVCDVINPIYSQSVEKQALCAIAIGNGDKEYYENSCVSYKEAYRYFKNAKMGYGWHISNLVIYDKPRELREFIRICPEWEKEEITEKCLECEHLYRSPIEHFIDCDYEGELPITRPFQSWGYVYETDT